MKLPLYPILAVASLLAALLFFAGCAAEKPVDAPAIVSVMDSLLDQKEYFRLERQLTLHLPDLSKARRLYYAAILDNAFNRDSDCARRVDSLMGAERGGLSDSLKAKLLRYQGASYFKTGLYRAAAGVDSLLLHDYKTVMDSSTYADIKNDSLIRNALRDVPPQQVSAGTGSEVSWSRDALALIELPIRLHAQSVNAIFDTRANISSITRTFAEKLRLRLLNVRYDEGAGMTGIQFKVGLAVADSLWIGNVLVRNAIFQVMPDSIFYIAPIHFQLNLILGYPIIAGLQEVRLFGDGKMEIPSTAEPGGAHNMFMDRLDPVLRLTSGADTLLFDFDSGAGTTVLYSTYFRLHQAAVQAKGTKKKTSLGGAGGVKTSDTYELPALPLTLGARTVRIDSVTVLTEKITPGERFSGNLGEDFMRQFKLLVINFRYVYVRAE